MRLSRPQDGRREAPHRRVFKAGLSRVTIDNGALYLFGLRQSLAGNINMIRVKICCIKNIEEARIAVEAGAAALGFVSAMPSGPGVISEAKIAEIVKSVPPAVGTFLLTSKRSFAEILKQHEVCRTNSIQFTDSLPLEELFKLRESLRGISLVQVIHVTGEESIEEAVAVAPFVDAILLDSGNPNLAVKELGGTGRVHDWNFSRRIRDAVSVPIFLAGGLRPENVTEAIAKVNPFGLDLCSGVRTNDNLDPAKLKAVMQSLVQQRMPKEI